MMSGEWQVMVVGEVVTVEVVVKVASGETLW
jgi:hypothetical protein